MWCMFAALPSNRLTKLEGLSSLVSLQELYVSHNGISTLEGLEALAELHTLDVGR